MFPKFEDGFLFRWGPLWIAFVDDGTHVIWRQVRQFSLPTIRKS
jgi:hypothetical protein